MIKRLILLVTCFLCLNNLNAQEENNIKLALEAGIIPILKGSQNVSLYLNVEPKIKITEESFLGLRIGVQLNSLTFENNDPSQYNFNNNFDNGALSFVPTYDRFWNKGNITSYVGMGIGVHYIPDPIDVFPAFMTNPSENIIEGRAKQRLGILMRGGFEFGKLRLGVEYNLVPKTDVKIPSGQMVGKVKKSFLGISIGHVFGNG